jgi:N-acetylglucosaminyldiphosphoundecaprenol N-acetyl-beta-D-mannosaminyltransferase
MITRLVIKRLRFLVGDYDSIIEEIVARITNRNSVIVVAGSLNDVASASLHPVVASSYHEVDICTTDGMPLVWWAWLRVHHRVDRVYGPDLMKSIIRDTQAKGARHVFCGSSTPRLMRLVDALTRHAPKTCIAGLFAPQIELEETAEERSTLRQIITCKPSVLWVGISTPKQVALAARWKKHLPQTAIICVGAAFDQVSGVTRRPPGWIQAAGLEWLFRLASEPVRLHKRYLFTIPRFLVGELLSLAKGS